MITLLGIPLALAAILGFAYMLAAMITPYFYPSRVKRASFTTNDIAAPPSRSLSSEDFAKEVDALIDEWEDR